MQVVFEEVCAAASSVTIIYCKERALGPSRRVLVLWPGHVQDYRHPIFIVVSLDALVGVRCVARDQTVRLRGEFGILEIF